VNRAIGDRVIGDWIGDRVIGDWRLDRRSPERRFSVQ